MGTIERYMAYAAAFEETYASDNWSQLEPFFTEDAAYVNVAPAPFGGEYKGRTAVPTNFKPQRTALIVASTPANSTFSRVRSKKTVPYRFVVR